ncbi:taste receptor type 1 member 3 [Pogona vitticeps]
MAPKLLLGLLAPILSLRMSKAKEDAPATRFNAPGDFIIGGMFAFHSKVQYPTVDGEPHFPACYSFYHIGYLQHLAMRFAIEEINNSTSLLPGIRLGYEVHDTCNNEAVATKPALAFLSRDPENDDAAAQCDYANAKPRVIAVVGPSSSALSMLVTRILNFLSIPEVSFGSSSSYLSDRQTFPSFFRTIPSDSRQADAIVQLLNKFNWNWVAALATDNLYGRQALEIFTQEALLKDICVAYEAILPDGLNPSEQNAKLIDIADRLENSHINATVVFASPEEAKALLRAVVATRITRRVWIASECWSASPSVALIPGISNIGTLFGIAIKSGAMPGFAEYVQNLLAQPWPGRTTEEEVNEQCPECGSLTYANFSRAIQNSRFYTMFNAYKAVYAIGHALHQLLHCDTASRTCDADREVYPWQLLEEIARVNFTVESEPVYFTETGDPPTGYDLILWDWIPPKNHTFGIVGSYDALERQLTVNESKIKWNTEDGKLPVSRCTQECKPGQKRWLRGEHNCCYECEDCPAGSFQDQAHPTECTPCPQHQWSPAQSTKCFDRAVEYLEVTDLLATIMVALTGLALAQMAAVTGVLLRHHASPAVRYMGRFPASAVVLSSACCCTSCFLFVTKPTDTICKLRQPIFFGSFAVCLAALLGTAVRRSGLEQTLKRRWLRKHHMGFSILLNTAVQGLLCLLWYYWNPPSLEENTELDKILLLQCEDSAFPGFTTLLAHVYCLALFCCFCSLVGQGGNRMDRRATKAINFAVVLILIIWTLFLPAYVTSQGKFVALFQIFAGLASILAIFGSCYYPVCYVVLFAPHLNTDDYFSCLPQDPPADKEKPSAAEAKG